MTKRIHPIEWDGKVWTASDLAREYDLPPATFIDRIWRGWPVKCALTVKPKPRPVRKYYYNGQYYTVRQLAALNGELTPDGIKYRLERGQSIKQIVETPKHPGTQRAESKRPKKQKPGRWVPRHTAEDLARCRKCRYSEDDSNLVVCMYLANHRPPERRGCEPGKNCKRFERKTAESERKKREGIVS